MPNYMFFFFFVTILTFWKKINPVDSLQMFLKHQILMETFIQNVQLYLHCIFFYHICWPLILSNCLPPTISIIWIKIFRSYWLLSPFDFCRPDAYWQKKNPSQHERWSQLTCNKTELDVNSHTLNIKQTCLINPSF